MLNGEVFVALNALKEINSIRWPVKVSLELGNLTKALSGAFEVPDRVRSGLVEKYATTPGRITPTDPNWELFSAEYNELMTQPIEVEFEKVVLPLEVDGIQVRISPNAISDVKSFISFK